MTKIEAWQVWLLAEPMWGYCGSVVPCLASRWPFKWLFLLKAWEQRGHWKGRSPACILKCCFRLKVRWERLPRNSRPHTPQTELPSPPSVSSFHGGAANAAPSPGKPPHPCRQEIVSGHPQLPSSPSLSPVPSLPPPLLHQSHHNNQRQRTMWQQTNKQINKSWNIITFTSSLIQPELDSCL